MKPGRESFSRNYQSESRDLPYPEGRSDGETVLLDPETRTFKGIDFSTSLGEGFDGEFFEGKLEMYSTKEYVDAWNDFLSLDSEELSDRKIERDWLDSLLNKLSGYDSAKMMFPVFIQYLQSGHKNKSISGDHVTPERMQHFYNYLTTTRAA